MNDLWHTMTEISLAEHIAIYLLEICLLPFAMERLYKWLYWKTKWSHFKTGNWLCSPEETDAYCLVKDRMKQEKENKRGRN